VGAWGRFIGCVGERGRTGEGAAGAGREARGGRGLGTSLSHGDGVASRGAWRGQERPGKAGFKQTRGAEAVWSWDATRGRPGGRRRRTDAVVGAVQEGAEVGDEAGQFRK